MKQTFEIPGRLPSLNDYIKACRSGPKVGGKFKRQVSDLICWSIKQARLKPMGRVNVSIHWIEPNMRRDKDNVRAGIKFILDALVDMGVIEDDGWKYIGEITDKYSVNRKNPRIIVKLEET